VSHNIKNILSIDVEDYFQINAFSDVINYNDWKKFESRVERNTIKILDLLDLGDRRQETEDRGKEEDSRQKPEPETLNLEPLNLKPLTSEPLNPKTRATFFILGWIAERYPNLVKEIHNRGHEVACHGYAHQLIFKQDRDTFKDDVKRAKEILEDITGESVIGYRAPTYTITKQTMWALEVLYELGFKYDSSIFPIKHDVYGWPESPRFPYLFAINDEKCEIEPYRHSSQRTGIQFDDLSLAKEDIKSIIEFPISTFRLFNKNIPVGGGGYFRLFPYLLTRAFLNQINNKEGQPFVFYLHPWEVDPEIPKMNKVSALSRFRTYLNLDKTFVRLQRLITDFNFICFKDIL
jgi:polysaccharide deacetylase family protein (PEP-CTERM system associated)